MDFDKLDETLLSKMSDEGLHALIDNLNNALKLARTERNIRCSVRVSAKTDVGIDLEEGQHMSMAAVGRLISGYFKNPNTTITCKFGNTEPGPMERGGVPQFQRLLQHLHPMTILTITVTEPGKDVQVIYMRRANMSKIRVAYTKDKM